MEDDFHYPLSGLSTEEAFTRLVKLGRDMVATWKCTEGRNYLCSPDRLLCLNLLIFSLLTGLLLLIGAVTIDNQLSVGLLLLSTAYIIFVCFAHYAQWKQFEQCSSVRRCAALRALNYVEKLSRSPLPYAPLGEPLADDMLTQTVLRDDRTVAVPRLLLVEDDLLLLRPSQAAPCDCRLGNGETLRKGDRLMNKVLIDERTGAATPLAPIKAVAISTPLVDHLNTIGSFVRKPSPLDLNIHYCVHVIGERIVLPVLVFVSVFACITRFFHDGDQSLLSTRFVFAVPSLIVLPYTTPTIFFILILIQERGNTAVRKELRTSEVNSMKDFVALLGSLTGTSFFDKKGLLSPMNPCLDKVIFFRPSEEDVETSKDSTCLEIMDLSSKLHRDGSWSVDFDDPNWSRFDSNLRVIGQCLLMNRCDIFFTSFLDHLSAVASTVPRTIATACRRCCCIFPQLIGFDQNCTESFRNPQSLGFYQRRPGETPLPGLTRHQTPLEMAYCTVHADESSLYYHLVCQGTANLVLEASTHVWNGKSLVPISGRLCKTATDFYQRHSVTGYCLALSYRPLSRGLDTSLKNYYFEVPLLHNRNRIETLVRSHSVDSSRRDAFFKHGQQKTANDVTEQFLAGHILCGMIVSQYEVMPQAVQLVDQLENLCVRFVYFSRENELRSRVFAEKLGLEAGWNCHVSLAEFCNDDGRTLKDFFLSKTYRRGHNKFRDKLLDKLSRSDEQLHFKFSSSCIQDSPSVQSQIPPKVAVIPNKAQLPTGVSAVRPHLEQVDNVPLLVSLITDCTPQANLEMLEIMQEYGEEILAIGSSLSPANTHVFLQVLAVPQLIVACRHRLASVRGSLVFHFFGSGMLSLSLLFSVIFVLPLLYDYDQVFLTVFVQLPLLTIGSAFTPFHPKNNVIRICSKNLVQVPRQGIKWAAGTFLLGFLPTSLYLLITFFFLLVGNATLTCSFVDVVCSVAADHNSDVPLSTVSIRHIMGLYQIVFLCALSSAWVYPLSSLWNDNPFMCLPWAASCVFCFGTQVSFSYASEVPLHAVLSIFSLSGLIIWTFLILVVNEIVKVRSIRNFTREQRRTKLGFDTKLGMNSPY